MSANLLHSLRIAGPMSVRARPTLPAVLHAAVAGRPHNAVLAPARRNGFSVRGVQGRQLRRSFHATAAARQGSDMWNEKPWQTGVVVVPQQMAYVSRAESTLTRKT